MFNIHLIIQNYFKQYSTVRDINNPLILIREFILEDMKDKMLYLILIFQLGTMN